MMAAITIYVMSNDLSFFPPRTSRRRSDASREIAKRMSQTSLYPLRFEPIYQYRLWGGRRLADLLTAPLPGDGPIGEAWLLSDRDDHPSSVADGPLKGSTIRQLLEQLPDQLLGKLAGRFRRFPLLLKFLDARESSRSRCIPRMGRRTYLPAGETGKTEAWVVLEAGPESRIYAGLKPGTTQADLRQALANGAVADLLASFTPKPGDAVFLRPGPFTLWAATRGVRSAGKQRRHVSPVRLGSRRPQDGQAAASASRAGACLHRFRARRDRSGGAGGGGGRRRCCASDSFIVNISRLWRLTRTIAVHGRRRGYAAGAGCIVGEGQLEHGGTTYRRRQRRRRALAGGGRRVFLPAARCGHRAGNRAAGMSGG